MDTDELGYLAYEARREAINALCSLDLHINASFGDIVIPREAAEGVVDRIAEFALELVNAAINRAKDTQ